MKGCLFLIVGNSGTGKDSVMKYAAEKSKALEVAKRVITRPESKDTEDFISMNPEDFKKEDYFLSWESYGKHYGISKSVFYGLEQGKNYLVNVSRDVIKEACILWDKTYVIECVVPIELIRNRLLERGRENEEEVILRIKRAATAPILNPDFTIDTSEPDVSVAGENLLEFVKEVLK